MFDINFNGGHDDDSRRDTLEEGGPLTVAPVHWIVTARSELGTLKLGGDYEYQLHYLEYIFLDVLDWPSGLMDRGLLWYLFPKKMSRFLRAGHAATTLKWEKFRTDEEVVQHLLAVKASLPIAEQGFTLADVHAYPVPAPIINIMDRARAIMLKTADGKMTAAVDFKCMLSDAYVASRRNQADGHHASMLAVMLDAASTHDLASKPLPVQASTLCRYVLNSQPLRALRRYLPYEMQEQEISRRSLDASGQFVPLLSAAWDNGTDGGYPELKLALLHACSSDIFIANVRLLAVRARMTELTATTTAALCDMLRGEILAEVDTAEMRKATIQTRCARIGDMLAAAQARSSSMSLTSGPDKAAADKLRASALFVSLVTSLEALVCDEPDYKAVIKLLAPTAVGRIFIAAGTAASPVMTKFSAARRSDELDEALNSLLAVDEGGKPLGKNVVAKGLALKVRNHPPMRAPWHSAWRYMAYNDARTRTHMHSLHVRIHTMLPHLHGGDAAGPATPPHRTRPPARVAASIPRKAGGCLAWPQTR